MTIRLLKRNGYMTAGIDLPCYIDLLHSISPERLDSENSFYFMMKIACVLLHRMCVIEWHVCYCIASVLLHRMWTI